MIQPSYTPHHFSYCSESSRLLHTFSSTTMWSVYSDDTCPTLLKIWELSFKHQQISHQQRAFLSMERTFKQDGVQVVKMAMLKQEEIFKQQVKELHRLYNLQRMLMEEVKKEMTRQSKYSSSNGWERSGSCSGGESETRFNAKRSLGFDSDIIRVRGGDDHQEADSIGMSITMGPSSTITAGSSRIMGASHNGLQEELCGLDLTLSIGGGDKKRLKELQDSSRGLEKL